MTLVAAGPTGRPPSRPVQRPVWILHVFVVGLALHNVVMAELYAAGVRGTALDVVSAWKEALLVLGLVLVLRAHGRRPFDGCDATGSRSPTEPSSCCTRCCRKAALGGGATRHGVLLGLRHDWLPVAAYFFGRGLGLSVREFRALVATILGDRASASPPSA